MEPGTKSLLRLLLFTASILFTTSLAVAQTPVYFGESNYYNKPQQSVVADMNADGHPDIVSASGSAVNVMLNAGDGTFTGPGNTYAPTPFSGETEISICAVAVGDLNGDGKPDVAAADCGSGVVHVFTNNGDGSLTFNQDLVVGGTASSVVIADLNHDGKLDVAATSDTIKIFYNLGAGVFSPAATVSVASSAHLSSLTSGDINADGLTDLAVLANAGTGSAQVYQLKNQTTNGSSTPSFAVTLVDSGTGQSVRLVDIDKDGRADLLIPYGTNTNCTTPCNNNGVTWIFNNADGTRSKSGYSFVSPGGFFVGGGGADAADLNGDGLNDIVVSVRGNRNESNDEVRYLLATGPRTFAPVQPSQISGDFGVAGVDAADVNNDGLSDIVATLLGLQATDVKLAHSGNPGWGVSNSQYCAPGAAGTWNICAPIDGQTYASNGTKTLFFQGVATAPSGTSVLSTQLFIDGLPYDSSSNRGLIALQNLANGAHTVLFRANLGNGGQMDKSIVITVGSTACAPPSTASVVICTPPANSDVTSPVTVAAAASAPSGETITAMKLYIDSTAQASSTSNTLNASVTLAAGVHKVTVNAWTNTGVVEKTTEYITVTSTTGGGNCIPGSAQSSIICKPNASSVPSPVNVVAGSRAASGSYIYSMRVYVDGVSKVTISNPTYHGTTQQIDVNISMSSGTHKLSVVTYESNGAPTMNVSENVNVQ